MAISAVGSSLEINRALQVEHLDQAFRPKIEVLPHEIDDAFFGQAGRAEGIYGDRRGLCHADRIGDLDLTAIRQACRDDVLGHVASRVGGAAVYLGRILAGKCAAAVPGRPAVGIDNDLAARETAVAKRTPDNELPGGVDVVPGVRVQPFFRQDVADDVFHYRVENVRLADVGIVLG